MSHGILSTADGEAEADARLGAPVGAAGRAVNALGVVVAADFYPGKAGAVAGEALRRADVRRKLDGGAVLRRGAERLHGVAGACDVLNPAEIVERQNAVAATGVDDVEQPVWVPAPDPAVRALAI